MSGFLLTLLLSVGSEALLQQANAAAEQGRYDEALATYRELLANDPDATGAWLNLGNTAYRAGELGRAIAAFRVAEAKAPRDLRVAGNLDRARRDVEDRIDPPEPSAALRALFFWHYAFSAAELGWLVVVVSPLVWGIGLAMRRRRQAVAWISSVGGVVVFALFVSWAIRTWNPRRVAVVERDAIPVRTSTDRRSDVRFELNEGSELRWRERSAGWVRVALPSGQQGWVHEDHVIVLEL